jgi:hypothetical protein
VNEPACPFCASPLPESLRATPPPRGIAGRHSRAALYALGASAITLAGGCVVGGGTDYGAPPVFFDASADRNDTADAAEEVPAQFLVEADIPFCDPVFCSGPGDGGGSDSGHVDGGTPVDGGPD